MSLFPKTFTNQWPIAVLFLLPMLPQMGYLPLAIGVTGIVGVILALQARQIRTVGSDLLQLGMILLGAMAIVAATKIVLERDISALTYGSSTLMTTVSLVIVLSLRSFRSQTVPRMALGMLLFWTAWVAWHAVGSSFEELNSRLTYENGLGNVSQIAMYSGFAGLCWAANSKDRKWEWPVVCGTISALAWWLDSKLLWGILFLSLLSLLTRNTPLLIRRLMGIGMGLGALFVLWIFKPSSLQGRLDVLQIALDGRHQIEIWGSGLGGMEPFLNGLFYQGVTPNTVGEIGPYAFNEYLQTLIELGPLGLLAILVVTISVWAGEKPILALGWMAISAIMFPLQYIESAALWALTATIIAQPRFVSPKVRIASYKIGLFFSSIALAMFFFLGIRFHGLYRADQLSLTGKMASCLQTYRGLAPAFKWNPQFHLKYATRLAAHDKISESLEEHRIAAALNPSYTAVTHLADACFEYRLYEEALLRYRQAQLLRPLRLFPQYRQVFCLLELGQNSEALDLATLLCARFGESEQGLQIAMVNELRKLTE